MRKLFFYTIIFAFSSIVQGQNRIEYNHQELFLSGANLAWLNYSNDLKSENTNLEEFAEIMLQIHENGGNSLRWWLHTSGSSTPEFGNSDFVIGPGEFTIQYIRKVLDLAWEREIGLKLCLWSFDMLRSDLAVEVKDRNILLLTDTTYTMAYIRNSLIPMVDSLKGHPAIIAWEIFNEPEGMSDEFGWNEILHVPMSDIQRFINLASGAIHRTDTTAQVTSGCWSFQAMSDVTTNSLSKLSEFSATEREKLTDFVNSKYKLSLTSNQLFEHLNKIFRAGNKNYYSDDALITAGGDSTGILDFYSVHFYPALTSAYSPFEHSAAFWNLNKPIVIAEFGMVKGYGIPKDLLFETLYQAGYAGSLPWSWTDTKFSSHEDMLSGMKSLWDNYQEDVDVLGIGGDWPIISIISPTNKEKFEDTSAVNINIEASDSDGDIVLIEIFINDSLKIGEILNPPYTFVWDNIEPGEYKISAVAIDNDGHSRKSKYVSISYGDPPYVKLEAEVVVIPNVGITIAADPGASNGAYVEMRETDTSVKWEINNLLPAGNYQVKFGYRLSFDTPKGQFINVNGTRVTELMFDGEVNKWLEKELTVNLVEGSNSIEIEPSWGWMDIDYLAIPRNIITSVNSVIKYSNVFRLEQNYPNPFNPTTNIRFSIPSDSKGYSKIKLHIFDVIGNKIKTLVDEVKKPGHYEITFDASNLSSGVYIYSLETNSFTMRKKMIYIK